MSNRYLVLEHYDSGKGSTAIGGDGSLSYLVYANDGSVLQTQTALGIEEYPAGSTDYRVSVPDYWAGVIQWFLDSSPDSIAAEMFEAVTEGMFGGPVNVTFQFRDATGAAVSGVTFVVNGIGTAIAANNGRRTVGLVNGSYVVTAVPSRGLLWPATSFSVAGVAKTITVTAYAATDAPASPVTAGGRGIQLTRSELQNVNHYHLHAFRLRVAVTDVTGGMDRYVFVYSRRPANPVTGAVEDVFETVASAVDVAEYPAGAPDPETDQPFFRKDFVELDVRSSTEHEEVWTLLRQQVCRLVAALDRMEELVPAEVVWCGEPAADSSASSLSA